jgi:hypothetical protein
VVERSARAVDCVANTVVHAVIQLDSAPAGRFGGGALQPGEADFDVAVGEFVEETVEPSAAVVSTFVIDSASMTTITGVGCRRRRTPSAGAR